MTSGCAPPGRVWVCGRSTGRSDSCATKEPPPVARPDNSQPRGIPCGPISSRVCKPHLMTPPVSQACGCWGLTRGVWYHQDRRRRGPRELTGIVDLTRGEEHPAARLSGSGPRQVWHRVQELARRARRRLPCGVRIATLDPFQGYKNAIDDQLQDATSVLDAFHIVKLAGDALDEVRRRVQQDTTGHRGRKGDPLYQIRLLLRASHTQAHPAPTRTPP